MPRRVENPVDLQEKVKRPNPPHTKVKSAGKVSRRLETLAAKYKQNNPGRDCRWVFNPTHKPELSNVLDRTIDGYQQVKVSELGEDIAALLPGLKSEDLVQVGDLALMSIDADVRAGFQRDLAKAAREELSRVNEEFYHTVEEEMAKGVAPEHRARPRGRSVIEEVEREIDVDSSLKE